MNQEKIARELMDEFKDFIFDIEKSLGATKRVGRLTKDAREFFKMFFNKLANYVIKREKA